MIKSIVIGKDKYDYKLKGESKEYKLNIEFINTNVEVGDFIYLDESIVREKNMYTFGPMIEDKNAKEKDIIKVIRSNQEFYLQRYYG